LNLQQIEGQPGSRSRVSLLRLVSLKIKLMELSSITGVDFATAEQDLSEKELQALRERKQR
jgi:hypothetical protein